MNLIKKSADVYLAAGPISTIGATEIDFLRKEVAGSTRGRLRINLHPDNSDMLHEMFIAIKKDSYIRPHRHPAKSEAVHIVHGEVDVVVFEDDGRIREVVSLAASDPDKAFYYRMSAPLFHTLLIRTDLLIVHEITNGPFIQDGTLFGDFSPEEDDRAAVDAWHSHLSTQIESLK